MDGGHQLVNITSKIYDISGTIISVDGCTPEFAQVGSGITGNISWSGPSRQWYRPSFRAVPLFPSFPSSFPFLNSFLASSSTSLREHDSLGGLFSPFHPRFVFHPSLFVRGRIMVFRSIVLFRPGRRRQIELKICDLAVCKVVRLSPRSPPQPSSSLRRGNPLLLICHRCRLLQPLLLATAA